MRNKWKKPATLVGTVLLSSLSLSAPALTALDYPPPAAVQGQVNTPGNESNPEPSCDESILRYSATNGEISEAFADGNGGYINPRPVPGINTPDTPGIPSIETSITVSCDDLESLIGRYMPSDPCSGAIYRGLRANPPDDFVTTLLSEVDWPGYFEDSPSLFDNALRFALARTCDAPVCGCDNSLSGAFEYVRADRNPSTLFTPGWRSATNGRMNELDALGGNITAVGMSQDGLKMIISGIGFTLPGGYGGGDYVYLERTIVDEPFNIAAARYLGQVNTTVNEGDAAFTADASAIYFGSNGTWPDSQGAYDVYVSRLGCTTVTPAEVSPNGSQYPLRVTRDSGNLRLSFDSLLDNCGITYNWYRGDLTFIRQDNATDFDCFLPATVDPVDPNRRFLDVPYGPPRSEMFLVTASNKIDEGPAGFDSSGNPKTLYHFCGPTP